MTHRGFPNFLNEQCRDWFFHWLEYKISHCPSTHQCIICDCCINVIKFATNLFLESLYQNYDIFTSGSDIVSININSISVSKARKILMETSPHDTVDVSISRLKNDLDSYFPGLRYSELPDYANIYAPFMGKGGNTLYEALSLLYRGVIGEKVIVSQISLVEYCLLCFNINGLYFLTANMVGGLWSVALTLNSITTLMEEKQTDVHNMLLEEFV